MFGMVNNVCNNNYIFCCLFRTFKMCEVNFNYSNNKKTVYENMFIIYTKLCNGLSSTGKKYEGGGVTYRGWGEGGLRVYSVD